MLRAPFKVVLKPKPKKARNIAFILLSLAILILTVQYHRSVNFSYTGQSCFRDLTFLPKILKPSGDGTYSLSYQKSLSIRDYPLLSTKSCVYAVKAPQEKASNKVYLSMLNVALPNKKFSVKAEDFPKLDTSHLSQKISVRDSLKFPINKTDNVFDYRLSAGEKQVECETINTSVICPVTKLSLKQNQPYNFEVGRYFKGQSAGTAAFAKVITLEPVEIIKTSVAQNAVVYDKPAEITLTANKKLVSAKANLKLISPDGKATDAASELILDNSLIKLKLAKPLERSASYEVHLTDAVAEDRGILFNAFQLSFKTSGGPKVLGSNIGSSSVEPGKTIVINFDQNLAAGLDVSSMVSMSSAGGPVTVKTTVSGNRLLIAPANQLPICSKFLIKLAGGLTNEFGVGGNSAWSINSRIRCYTTSNIGFSTQGRGITAWRFGSGPNHYVFLGATHGDEKSTKYLLDRWVNELDSNYDRLPAGTSVSVIPSLNPDGFYANSRRNANGVDLNRNFPADDWKKDVTMPGGELIINGGGLNPLSEPESQSIVNFVSAHNPKLVLTYHSVASIVSGNSVGFADAKAIGYADTSGYRYSAFGKEASIFNYDTTGSFEAWMHDVAGIPTILIELGSSSQSEFNLNRLAMWNIFN